MRDALIAFIESVQAAVAAGATPDLTLGSLLGTDAGDRLPYLKFGHWFHDPTGVLYFGPVNPVDGLRPVELLTPAEAVDKFLAALAAAPIAPDLLAARPLKTVR